MQKRSFPFKGGTAENLRGHDMAVLFAPSRLPASGRLALFLWKGRECKQGGCVGGSYGRQGTVVGVGVTVGVL